MSFIELYTDNTTTFGGFQCSFDEAKIIILGVPLDITSYFRSGSRFAPSAIRQASLNIESYSMESKKDLKDIKLHDLGNLNISGSMKEIFNKLKYITRELFDEKKIPIFIGGEHTITFGITRTIENSYNVVHFDAHLDLRNELMGQLINHGTVMRRVYEKTQVEKIVSIGLRATCREELEFADKQKIKYFTSQEIVKNNLEKTIDKVSMLLDDENPLYITIDLDVLDPAYAPAVQTPEPCGISTSNLLEILRSICNEKVLAIDFVEVSPHYDSGLTAIQTAKIISEVITYL